MMILCWNITFFVHYKSKFKNIIAFLATFKLVVECGENVISLCSLLLEYLGNEKHLTLSWRGSLAHRNQSIDLLCIDFDVWWFLSYKLFEVASK